MTRRKTVSTPKKRVARSPRNSRYRLSGGAAILKLGARRFQIAQQKMTRTLAGLLASLILQNRM